MNKIATFTLQGHDIDFLVYKKELGYTMKIEGKDYGQKVKLESRKVIDIASAVVLLLINALETHEQIKNENK